MDILLLLFFLYENVFKSEHWEYFPAFSVQPSCWRECLTAPVPRRDQPEGSVPEPLRTDVRTFPESCGCSLWVKTGGLLITFLLSLSLFFNLSLLSISIFYVYGQFLLNFSSSSAQHSLHSLSMGSGMSLELSPSHGKICYPCPYVIKPKGLFRWDEQVEAGPIKGCISRTLQKTVGSFPYESFVPSENSKRSDWFEADCQN